MKKELGTDAKGNYLPLRTDDEGRPVSPDTYIDDKIYSEEEMVSLFRKVNPGRKTRAEMTDFFPPLTGQDADGYFIMFDRANPLGGEPLPVGRVGWKYLPEHKLYLTTGIKVVPMYRGMGLSRSLWQKRDSAVIKNTPAIGMASNFSDSWLKLIQSEGWKVDPPVESLPESIQDEVRETIEGEKPRRLISKNIDMAMKKAWRILKVDTRPDIRNEAQYNAASLEERKRWHNRQSIAYRNRLSVLRTQHTVDLTDTENPTYQEMEEYQRLRNFHGRQTQRLAVCIKNGKTECNDFYSPELEGDNRRKRKLITTPTGKRDPYVELSLEEYNNLTDGQKMKYHTGMTKIQDEQFHFRMLSRIRDKSNQPTFPSPEYGGESALDARFTGKKYTKEEYENATDNEKRNYHMRQYRLQKKLGNKEATNFHGRMFSRIKRSSSLPIYYSPEHEQEEE